MNNRARENQAEENVKAFMKIKTKCKVKRKKIGVMRTQQMRWSENSKLQKENRKQKTMCIHLTSRNAAIKHHYKALDKHYLFTSIISLYAHLKKGYGYMKEDDGS